LRIRQRWLAALTVGAGFFLFSTASASAQSPEELSAGIEGLMESIDVAWLIIAGILVLFMQAGFGLVEAGFIRSKNVTNILMKNVLDASLGAISYWAIGFGLAYGTAGAANMFFGFGSFFLINEDDYATFFFQFAFAATAATIVSGAMAERTKFSAYLMYTVVITGVIYPIVTHWVWDEGGWLTAFTDDPLMGVGMVDFAGSTVVHSVGGWAALMGAVFVGARRGKFNPDGTVNALPGHSLPLGFLGVLILWVGWYGFNAGSTLGLSDGLALTAARVATTTTLAAGAGAATAMFVSWLRSGKSDLSLTVNGVLGGLVGITAGAATVPPWAAVIIGIVAGVIIVYGVAFLDAVKVDDPVGAVPVHLFNGIWGTLAVGLFTSQSLLDDGFGMTEHYGLLMGGGANLLAVNAIGVIAVGAWTVATAGILFAAIRAINGLRVSPEEEDAGLDVGEHGMEAYPEFTGGRDPFSSFTAARPAPSNPSPGSSA
jgi:ammonium transporter, Amt family